jgi:hypothetical protein
MAGTSELVRECTTDFTGTDDGNRQRRFSCESYIFQDDFSFDSFSSGQGWLSALAHAVRYICRSHNQGR